MDIEQEDIRNTGTAPSTGERRPFVIEGYEDEAAFLTEAREEFALDMQADKENRDNAMLDLEFLAGEQWDEAAKQARMAQGRPCFVVNTLPQFVGQVIGDRRMNRTSIRCVPKIDATVEMAEVRSGLIKSIESFSDANRVYDAALEDQVSGGIGNFRIAMDYSTDDVFEQDIFVRQIANPFAVVWDRMSIDPTGKDALHCFVQDSMPEKAFKARWPNAGPPSDISQEMAGLRNGGWITEGNVRVTEYWRIVEKPATLAMFADGTVHDITGKVNEEIAANIMINPRTGLPVMRQTVRRWAVMYLITGFAVLEGPYELPLTRLPIIRVMGREIRVGEKRVRFGLIRWARDPVRMRNYWRSIAIETLAMAPKNQWLAQAKSVEGREEDFRQAHVDNDPLLVYNDNTEAPQRSQGAQPNNAVLQESQMNTQDIKDTTGMQDASLGIRSNEVSGKAIMARQREGDVATIVYHDNLNAAIKEGGVVIDQLIPICYDTTRTMRVLGQDDQPKLVKINDPMDPESPDLSKGKYDITLDTGPSFTTQRIQSAEAMMEAIQVAPQLMEVAGDLIVSSQDWPGAQQIAERLKKAMPPELTAKEGAEPTPEQLQQMQLAEQQRQVEQAAAEEAAELQSEMQKLALAEKDAQVLLLQAQAREADARADKAESDAELAEINLASEEKIIGVRTARTIHDLSNEAPQPQGRSAQSSGATPGSKPSRRTRRNQRDRQL